MSDLAATTTKGLIKAGLVKKGDARMITLILETMLNSVSAGSGSGSGSASKKSTTLTLAAKLAALQYSKSAKKAGRDWREHEIILLPKEDDPDQTDWTKTAASNGLPLTESNIKSYHIGKDDELQVPPGQYVYATLAPLVKEAMEKMRGDGKNANAWSYGAVIVRCDRNQGGKDQVEIEVDDVDTVFEGSDDECDASDVFEGSDDDDDDE
jgi:hypothetical protein